MNLPLIAFLLFVCWSSTACGQSGIYSGYYQVKDRPELRLRVYQTADQKWVAVIPGEPNYDLLPTAPNQFAFKAPTNPAGMKLADYKIIFSRDSLATTLIIERPKRDFPGNLIATRIAQLDAYAIDTEVTLTQQRQTPGFVYYFDPKDSVRVNPMIDQAERAYAGLLKDFGIKRMPKVLVRLYSTLDQYHNAVNTPLAPDWQQAMTWGSTKDYQEIRTTVPLATDSLNGLMTGSIVHEFVHLLTLQISPQHRPSPVWLWEGVAIYKGCCQWVQPAALSYLQAGEYPSIMAIESGQDYAKSYELGFYFVEYMVAKWGWERVLKLIQTGGRIKGALGLSPQQFNDDFFGFITTRYSLNQK